MDETNNLTPINPINSRYILYSSYIGGNSLKLGICFFDNVPILTTLGSTFANIGIVISYNTFHTLGEIVEVGICFLVMFRSPQHGEVFFANMGIVIYFSYIGEHILKVEMFCLISIGPNTWGCKSANMGDKAGTFSNIGK